MKKCENCESKHDGNYGSGRFCSSKCSRGFSTKSKRKEINEKVSKTLIGRIPSEETKKKLSENNPKYWLGKKISKETIKKIKEGRKKHIGKINPNKECKNCKEKGSVLDYGTICKG